MISNPLAIITFFRNRLHNTNYSFEDNRQYFHNKGINLSKHDDLYFLRQSDGYDSKLKSVCCGVIIKDTLICFHKEEPKSVSLEEAKTANFIWDKNTVLYKPCNGIKLYLYWNNDWVTADDNKPISSYTTLTKKNIYNIMSLDVRYTYELIYVQSGEEAGLYLITMYDNKNMKELRWQEVDSVAGRHKLYRPELYQFTKFEDIEESDLPIVAVDISMNKLLIIL